MPKHLHFQVSILLTAGTFIVIILASWIVYNRSYANQIESVYQTTLELMETVADPATIASYLNQEDMLNDVVNGLIKNSIVSQATLVTTQGVRVTAGPEMKNAEPYTIYMILTSPFADGKVGELIVVQNKNRIQQRAIQTSKLNSITLIVVCLLLELFVVAVIYYFLTRPIRQITTKLHNIAPGSDKRLENFLFYGKNELGTLIEDINHLLQRTEQTLNSERSLRKKFEILEERYRTIFEQSGVAIFVCDLDGNVIISNPAFKHLRDLSKEPAENTGNICQIFADSNAVLTMLHSTRNKGQAVNQDLLMHQKDGKEAWIHAILLYSKNNDSDKGYIEGVLYDVTQRYVDKKDSQQIAERDFLTNLHNRFGVENKLNQFLGRREDDKQEEITIFFLDLDGFKTINDAHGHNAGDRTLVEVAKRLTSISRHTDVVARWGGDEFVIVLYGNCDKETCFTIGHKMLESIKRPIDLGNGHYGHITASIGVSTQKQSEFDKDLLIKSADMAMYKVKEQGKNGICYYDIKQNKFECQISQPQLRTEKAHNKH